MTKNPMHLHQDQKLKTLSKNKENLLKQKVAQFYKRHHRKKM